jgi:hypothetical protein
MGSALDRLASWFLSALTIIILGIIAYMGWYNYLWAGILLVIGMFMAFLSVQYMHGRVTYSNPFEPPPTSGKQTLTAILFLGLSIILFTLAFLLITGFIG